MMPLTAHNDWHLCDLVKIRRRAGNEVIAAIYSVYSLVCRNTIVKSYLSNTNPITPFPILLFSFP